MLTGRFPTFCLKLIGFVSLVMMSHGAMAEAPFCAESQTTASQCYYYDAALCRKEASSLGGVCVVNQEAVNLPEGFGNYCLVLSATTVQCLYLDYASCNQDAGRQNGVCVRNYTKPEPLPSYEYNPQNSYEAF